jgi:MFS transporter, DHA1 family, multidrug resistance protein
MNPASSSINTDLPEQSLVQKPRKQFYLILILGLLTAIGPFSIDMYLPAFPDIAKNLNTTVSQVMLSLSSFFIGISIGQMIYGPLLERYGRKKPLYVGITIYLLASLGCAFSTSVDALIAFRFMQAMGGCVGMVASRAVVRDLFEGKQTAKIFSALMLVVAVSPIIAPTVGGYITHLFGWKSVFFALILIAMIILTGVYFLLPVSRAANKSFSLKPAAITKSYWSVMKHPQFYTYALTGAIAAAGLYAYISGSPAVFMELYGVNEKQYGWIFALIAIGIIGAAQLNNLALKKFQSEQIIKTATFFQVMTALTMVALTYLELLNLYGTITFIFLYLFCQGFIFPNSSALSLAPFPHNAGSASALMGAIQMGIGAGASAMVSVLQNGTAIPMTGVMACCALTAFIVFLFGRKIIIRASEQVVKEEEVEMINTL